MAGGFQADSGACTIVEIYRISTRTCKRLAGWRGWEARKRSSVRVANSSGIRHHRSNQKVGCAKWLTGAVYYYLATEKSTNCLDDTSLG
jgi:hypothetical protein